MPGLGVDFDLADMRAVGVGDRRRHEIVRRGEAGRHAGRQREAGDATQRMRDLAEALLEAGYAAHAHLAIGELEIVGRHFEHRGCYRLRLVGDQVRRDVQRAAGGDGLAARIGAMAERRGGSVAGDHLNAVGRDAEGFRRKLRQHSVGALALIGGAGGDHDRAGWPDAHAHALERPTAGAFDVVGEAESNEASLLSRRLLPRREIVPARRLQCAAL